MKDSDSVVVHLLDKEYRVACPPGEKDSLIRAARFLDDKMREVKEANVIGLERIAIMAALNLSHELLQTGGTQEDREAGQRRISGLLERIDREIGAYESYREDKMG